jgi:hypothetical protein
MDRFVRSVLDPNYYDFETEILVPFQTKRKNLGAIVDKNSLDPTSGSAADLSKKVLNQSKTALSRHSGTDG